MKIQIGTRLEVSEIKEIDAIASAENCTPAEIVRRAVQQFLQDESKSELEQLRDSLEQVEVRIIERLKGSEIGITERINKVGQAVQATYQVLNSSSQQ